MISFRPTLFFSIYFNTPVGVWDIEISKYQTVSNTKQLTNLIIKENLRLVYFRKDLEMVQNKLKIISLV